MQPRPQNLFDTAIDQSWPVSTWRNCHVLAAVSGGADSVAMLRGLVDQKNRAGGDGKIYAGHVNHGLRGAESDADERWVAQLCERLGVELLVTRAQLDGQGEDAARRARYHALIESAERVGARYVALAHTADDQVETVLMRVFRGSGLAGLGGIPFSRPLTPAVSLVRPLLSVRRTDIEGYLDAIGQDFRIDCTNHESQFTRNWIRNELLPLVREKLPFEIDDSVLRLCQQASKWSAAIEQLVPQLTDTSIEAAPGNSAITVHGGTLAGLPSIVVQEAIRLAWRRAGWPEQGMRMNHWQQLAEFVLASEQTPIELPGRIRVEKSGGESRLMLPAC